MEPSFPQLVILSYQELPSETRIEPFAAIALADQSFPEEVLQAMESSEVNQRKSAGRSSSRCLIFDDHAN